MRFYRSQSKRLLFSLMSKLIKNNKFLVLFLFILALLPRIVSVIFSNQVLLGDEVDYSQLAIQILEGKEYRSDFPLGFTNARPPLYPLFIAVIYFFTNHSILAAKLAQAVLGALICILVFFIAENIFKDRRISFGAGVVCAIYPLSIIIGKSLLSETLFTFLLASAIFFLLRVHDQPNLKNKFFSGLFLGLVALTKPVILAFMPFLIPWLILFLSGNASSRFKSATLIIIFMILTMMPWTIRNYIVFKEFMLVPTGSGVTFYVYNNENTLAKIHDPVIFVGALPLTTDEQRKEMSLLSESDRDRYLYKLGWEFAKLHPKDFFKIRLISLGQFWHFWPELPARYKEYYAKEGAYRSPLLDKFVDTHLLYFIKILYHLIYNILFIGMFISITYSVRKRVEFRKSLLLIFLLISVTLLHSIHGTDRYRLPTDPYVFLLGTHGLLTFFEREKRRTRISKLRNQVNYD